MFWQGKTHRDSQLYSETAWGPGVLTSTLCCRRVGSEATLWEYSFRCTVGTESRAGAAEVRLGLDNCRGGGEDGVWGAWPRGELSRVGEAESLQ